MTKYAISIQQPFAALVVAGVKDVENRGRYTSYRGPLIIHASSQVAQIREGNSGSIRAINKSLGLAQRVIEKYDYDAALVGARGKLVGTVDLVDCVQDSASKWAVEGVYHYILRNPQRLSRMTPWKGQCGIWRLEP